MIEISLHILDIVQNSIRANANLIEVIIDEQIADNKLLIEINDNGNGMTKSQLENVVDPFFTTRTTRNVGMGISLFKQSAEQTGGSVEIFSELSKGTQLKAVFTFDHIDRPILGDISGTMTLLIGANPLIRFIYTHKTPLSDFEFDTNEVLEELEGTPINHPDILKALKELMDENLEMIEATIN